MVSAAPMGPQSVVYWPNSCCTPTGNVEAIYLSIVQAQGGLVKMPVAIGSVFKLQPEAEAGWTVNSVSYNGMDVTEQLVDGVFTTPAISDNAVLNVSFERMQDGVSNARASMVRVFASGGSIVVKNAEVGDLVNVYAIDGKLLSTSVAEGGTMMLSVERGATYIVKAGDKVVKLAM